MAPSTGDDSNALMMPRTDGQCDDLNVAGFDLHNDASAKRLAISILMPSFNSGEYLQSAIESALSQLSDDDEIVVQDAQSTDGSAEYLTKLGEIDPRVMAVIEKDDGQSDALNRALARATNPWVIWLNADDMVLDSSLAALRDAIRCNPDVDLVIGAHQVIRADGSLVETYQSKTFDTYEMVKWGCAASSGSILMRTEFLRKVGGFETELDTVMDLALQLRMAKAQPRQIVLDAPIGAFRFHEMSKSTNQSLQFIRESHSVRMRYAMGGKQRVRASVATVMHCVLCSTLPIRLTPRYRSLRRRVARRVAR
jgi:GT2 family glycosyltransferase